MTEMEEKEKLHHAKLAEEFKKKRSKPTFMALLCFAGSILIWQITGGFLALLVSIICFGSVGVFLGQAGKYGSDYDYHDKRSH